jgi:hypothetical protein
MKYLGNNGLYSRLVLLSERLLWVETMTSDDSHNPLTKIIQE